MFVIKQTIAEKGTGKVKGVNYFGKELVYCSLKENLKSMTDYMFEKYSEAEEEIKRINTSEPYDYTNYSPTHDVSYRVIPYTA